MIIRGNFRFRALCLLLFCQVYSPAFSQIIFSQSAGKLNTGETPDLMLYDVEKGTTRMIMKGTVRRRGESNPAVSPDNSQIIFNTYRFSGWKLAIADYHQGEITKVRRFTSRPNYEYNGSWSHDGQKVTYQEYNWGTDKGEIFIRNQETQKVRKIVNGAGADRTPSFTRDDRHIIFNRQLGKNNEVFIVKTDGSGSQNISRHRAHDFAPSCSPKTDQIAFLSNRDGRLHLYLTDQDGSNLKDLTPELNSDTFRYDNWQNSGSWAYKTCWSPDGQHIVFNALIDGAIELFIVNTDGTGLRQITHNKGANIAPHWVFTRD